MISIKPGMLISCLPLLAGLAVTGHAGDDAAAADPDHYLVRFENDHLRVLELLASPRTESPMHDHAPSVVIGLSSARFKVTAPDGTHSIVDLHPGQVVWMERERHAWTLLSGPAHAFLVEVKTAADDEKPSPVPLPPDDSVAVDPVHHHVILENEHVRVYEGLVPPGATSPRHSHPPTLLVSLAKSRFHVTSEDKTWYFDFNPVHLRWINHFRHSWKVLAGHAQVIAIEPKSARDGQATGEASGRTP